MADEYSEFIKNYSGAYILIRTTSSEVFRPFFVKTQDRNREEIVFGNLLHEPSTAQKEKGIQTVVKSHQELYSALVGQGRIKIVAPQSTGVDTENLACFINLNPKKQYTKGWPPGLFNETMMGTGILDGSVQLTPATQFDEYPDISYNCLVNEGNKFLSMNEAVQKVEQGDKISCCISRNLAVGARSNIKPLVLYHRGQIKGIQQTSKIWAVLPEILKLSKQFNDRWGVSLKGLKQTSHIENINNGPYSQVVSPLQGLPPEYTAQQAQDVNEAYWAQLDGSLTMARR